MNLISIFFMLFLTSLTGTAAYAMWRLGCIWLQKRGSIIGIKWSLVLVIAFFTVPVSFIYLAWKTGLLGNEVSGNLFMRTPFLQTAAEAASVIWLIGFVYTIIRHLMIWYALRRFLRNAYRAEADIQEMAKKVEKRLGTRCIPVYMIVGQSVPAITGYLKCRILLPEKPYTEEELEMILEHELWHYKQGDLILKGLCGWINRIQWFNPLTKRLFEAVDKWGDTVCDLQVCFGKVGRSKKAYFYMIQNNSPGKLLDTHTGMNLRKSIKEVEERALRMSKYNPAKELKRIGLFVLSMCFTFVSSVTAMAAGKGVEAVYNDVYDATQQIILEERQPEIVWGEYEWIPDDSVVILDEEENPKARGSSTYDWTIPANTLKRTGAVYLHVGDTVTISIIPDPSNAATGIGLDQPNGYLRGVSGAGSYTHAFTVSQDGYHRIYARNETNSTIDVTVTVVIR